VNEWIDLPTGRFTMGSDDFVGEPGDDEGPARQVTVGSLQISARPVTVGQFAEFVDAVDYETTAERERSGFVGSYPDHVLVEGADWRHPRGPREPASPNDPVVQVSWSDAFEYCNWAGLALPTEAQWAYASTVAADAGVPIHGELWQWCADFYDDEFHRREQRVNPTGPTGGAFRVARGAERRGPRCTQTSAPQI
jgi:formylglycine-generating enzyme required for sulfatase activity